MKKVLQILLALCISGGMTLCFCSAAEETGTPEDGTSAVWSIEESEDDRIPEQTEAPQEGTDEADPEEVPSDSTDKTEPEAVPPDGIDEADPEEVPSDSADEADPEAVPPDGTLKDYTDVPEDAWYRDAVICVSEAGLMGGTGAGLFAPHAELTRAMFAQILFNACGADSDTGSKSAYTDVPEDAWYYDAVGWAGSAGLILGYGDGTFRPEAPVTRQDLAVMLWRLAGYQGRDTDNTEDVRLFRFPDVWDLAAYAEPAVKWVCGSGIMQGESDGRLNPSSSATRAQIAAVLARYTDPARALQWTQPRYVVVLDPGHGKSAFLMTDREKEAAGWVRNKNGIWGDWAHYAVGSGSEPCLGRYCSFAPRDPNKCFSQMVKSDRQTEPDLNLANALAAKRYLEQIGIEVRMTRTTNEENPSFTRRLSYCFPNNENTLEPDADVFVCIHSNAGGTKGSAYVAPSGTYDQAWIPADYVEKSCRLGRLCNTAIVRNSSLGQWGNGAITFLPDLIMFHKAPVPCAYLEIGFFDAPSDLAILRSESDRIGYGIAQGIHAYYSSDPSVHNE